jgi:hypothetical protein
MDLRRLSRGAFAAELCRERIAKRGFSFSGARLWSKEEDNRLRTHWPDHQSLLQALPDRTARAIHTRARKLGLTRKNHVWTSEEVRRLMRAALTAKSWKQVGALFPGLSLIQIKQKARYMRLRLRPQGPKESHCQVRNQIRQRAFELNISLRELDQSTGKGRYFSPSTRGFEPQRLSRIVRAVDLLGGVVTVAWSDTLDAAAIARAKGLRARPEKITLGESGPGRRPR